MQKMEGALSRHERYVPTSGLAGTTWHGDRAFSAEKDSMNGETRQPGKLIKMSAGSEALRSLANSREAVVGLEQALLDLEKQWQDGELGEDNARNWLNELVAQAGSIEEGVSALSTKVWAW